MKKMIALERFNRLPLKAIATTLLLGGLNSASAQVTETFTVAGTSSWTVPAGVTSIMIECWGGGGGGGGATSNAAANPGNQFTAAGGGGKGGMYTSTTLSVTSGTTYSLVVGAGGTAGSSAAGGAGGKSSLTLNGVDQAWASGGNGGGYGNNSNGTGATGYAQAAPSGVTVFNSGNGASGLKSTTRQSGGGGGGAAGSAGDGTTAVNAATGGGGPSGTSAGGAGGSAGGGAGGAGGSGTSGNATTSGVAGSTIGGAGGGARSTTTTNGNRVGTGGAGARGEIRITYTVNTCTANAGAALAYICENGTSAPLGGTVGGLSTTGIWNDGGVGGTFTPSATDLNATWTAPASYIGFVTLTLETTNGSCATPATASKTLLVSNTPATPVFSAGASTLCEGETSTYTATVSGTATVTYAILSGGATIDASTGAVSNTTGNFTVRATATNNCGTSTADFAVTVHANPAAPVISASGSTTFCSGGSVILSSSEASGNVWSSTETSQTITVSQNGTFTVTYTDGNGCSATSSSETVTVNTPVTPTIGTSGATTFCEGGSVTLTSSEPSGNLWSTGETTASIVADESEAITVTTTDGNGCTATSATIAVTENANPTPSITAGGPTTFCVGGSVTLTSSASSGNLWSTGETTESIVVDASDAITLTVTDANGCSGTSSATNVVETTSITPSITASGATTFCQGGSVTITSSETSENVWSTGATGNSIVVNQSTNVTLTNTNACVTGTSNEIVVTVNANPAVPTISAGGPLTFCQGGSVVLTSSAASGNVWSTTGTGTAITVTQAGSYTVTVTNANGCAATSAATTVVTNAVPVAGATLTNEITITATPAGQTYQWINCTTNQPVAGATSATFTATANGSYKVIVTNASGCKDTSACVTVAKVGLDDLAELSGISLYPNPTSGNVTITSDFTQSVNIQVFDASGKLLIAEVRNSGDVVNLEQFESGIYIFKVQTSKGMSSHRVVVQ